MIEPLTLIAQEGGASGSYMTIVIIVVFIAIFYFLLIRPGQKQRKAHQELVESINKGDEIMTAGGLFGTVTRVSSDSVMVEVAKKTEVKLAKNSIARVTGSEEEEEIEEEELEEEEIETEEAAGEIGEEEAEEEEEE